VPPPLVLLDRDGVLNQDRPDYVKDWSEWVWVPGAREALAAFRAAGVPVGVFTNQACVGKGLVTPTGLAAIHRQMQAEAQAGGGRIDAVFHCPHTDTAGCGCRKPAPGLIEQALAHFGLTGRAAQIPCIGDARRDLQACRAAGARPVLVRTGKGAETEAAGEADGVPAYDDLLSAARALLA
jgi:D-glycero-D-manno-heptose 1,7-bisphosphate phosphatase